MKTLLVLRHAKSSWKDPGLRDHERPLNKRGRGDAPRMGTLLRDEGLCPDLIISSTAERASRTADLVAEASGYPGDVLLESDIYHGAPAEYLMAVSDAPRAAQTVLVVGHNPAVQELVMLLTGAVKRMPTASLACIELEIDSWADVIAARGRLVAVWRPKELP